MTKNVRNTVLLISAFIALLLGLLVHKMLNPPPLSTAALHERGIYLFDEPREVNPVTLAANNGKPFTKANLQGKWSLVFFGFTHCPDVCPTTLAMLNAAQKLLPDELKNSTQVIMVSVDPARDTVEKMASYVPYFNPAFIGVTGDFIQILSFAGNLNAAFQKVMSGDKDSYVVDHSANIFLINPHGDYQGFFKPPFNASGFAANYREMRRVYL